jgi:hypothetical protein
MKRTRVTILGLLICTGCAADPEPMTVNIADITIPPLSISAEAMLTRENGGHVFLGSVPADMEPAPPQVQEWGGEWLAYSNVRTTVMVTDALGSTVGSEVDVTGSDGIAPVFSDADGNPTTTIVAGWEASPNKTFVPGEYLLFVVDLEGAWFLIWRADVIAGVVSGEGTMDAEGVSLESLRL